MHKIYICVCVEISWYMLCETDSTDMENCHVHEVVNLRDNRSELHLMYCYAIGHVCLHQLSICIVKAVIQSACMSFVSSSSSRSNHFIFIRIITSTEGKNWPSKEDPHLFS